VLHAVPGPGERRTGKGAERKRAADGAFLDFENRDAERREARPAEREPRPDATGLIQLPQRQAGRDQDLDRTTVFQLADREGVSLLWVFRKLS
jgi:hypothetical protein